MADGYPDLRVELAPGALKAAAKKRLKLYIEYPAALEGLEIGPPRTAVWERAVVGAAGMGDALPPMRILAVHGCRYLPVQATAPRLALARVAGYDTAVYGLPEQSSPLLFEWRDGSVLVAATKLSGFVTGRYAPETEWRTLWQFILDRLDPRHAPHPLEWTPAAADRARPHGRAAAGCRNPGVYIGGQLAVAGRVAHSARAPGLRSKPPSAKIRKRRRSQFPARHRVTARSGFSKALPRESSPTVPSSSACRSVTTARERRRCSSPWTR